jgi:hypothetical protein
MVVETNLHLGHGIVRGDVFSIGRTYTGFPYGNVVEEAWLTVKAAIADADAAATFQKIITTTNSAGTGHIEDDGATGTLILRFDLTSTNTLAMTADVPYFFDIQVRLDNNNILTLESGKTSARAQVTIDA